MEGKRRLATLVGCNYPNTINELHGCINDVKAMHNLLISRFSFCSDDITVLTDGPGSTELPTGANIMRALSLMAAQAEPGDVLFFHYSGHGTLIPAVKPHHGRSTRDEAIVPCDFNLITDVDFRLLVDRLPAGVSFTIISDSCHSGGLIDKEKEQLGPSANNHSASIHRKRTIPFSTVLDHVSSLSSIDSPHIGDHLLNLFGTEASAKFSNGLSSPQTIGSDDGILLSGCQTNETSADMSPNESGGTAYGAFSNAIQVVMKEHVGALSNRELVVLTRELLHERGFTQHPCLYCSDDNADTAFLLQTVKNAKLT